MAAFTQGLPSSKHRAFASSSSRPKNGTAEKIKEAPVYEKSSVIEECHETNLSNARSDEQTEGLPVKMEEPGRETIVPSNILEEGNIYFFFHSRVNIKNPKSIIEIARSFFILHPKPKGVKLEDKPISDDDNCRLVMLPKKRYPTSGRERYIGIVLKAKASLKTIQEEFFASETYKTKTRGERISPEARPFAEGLYTIVKEGRYSHLVYKITVPEQIGDLQRDFGIYSHGGFVIQVKNPKFPGPPSVRLPKNPQYPEDVMSKFRDLRWIPVEPEFLDYPNTLFLMIGSAHKGRGTTDKIEVEDDELGEKQSKFEDEIQERFESLGIGDHTEFSDLGINAK